MHRSKASVKTVDDSEITNEQKSFYIFLFGTQFFFSDVVYF